MTTILIFLLKIKNYMWPIRTGEDNDSMNKSKILSNYAKFMQIQNNARTKFRDYEASR